MIPIIKIGLLALIAILTLGATGAQKGAAVMELTSELGLERCVLAHAQLNKG
jgi:hypothetical protein